MLKVSLGIKIGKRIINKRIENWERRVEDDKMWFSSLIYIYSYMCLDLFTYAYTNFFVYEFNNKSMQMLYQHKHQTSKLFDVCGNPHSKGHFL